VLEPFAVQLAALLLATGVIGIVAHRLEIPYAVALVVVGLLIEAGHVVAVPQLEPELVLFIFLPPLLFDASFRLDAEQFRRYLRPILLLAVFGTLATALGVGAIVALVLQLPLAVALLFGSVVAATDPVAVLAVFKRLHVPGALPPVAEGESLLNDGVAITLYTVLIGFTVTGQADLVGAVELFGREVCGGLLIGAVLGFAVSRLTTLIDEPLIEMTLSTALAYGSYLAADYAGASGALSCVAAGLVHGTYGRRMGMSPASRERLDVLWEYVGFLANGLLFLLVGFSVDVRHLVEQAWPVTVAIVAVVAVRALTICVPGLLPRARRVLSTGEQMVLVWGGLRGALTLALALALPTSVPSRDLLVTMAFGVVLFTLVVQGLTVAPFLKLSRVTQPAQSR
jgi:CPA1 family monovalent cation:H+ antiporter